MPARSARPRKRALLVTLLVGSLVATSALAGCFGADDAGVDEEDAPVAPAAVRPDGQLPDMGWVFGVVRDAVTNDTVEGVNVSLNQGLGAAVTNASGAYVIPNVPRGEYVISARAPEGYLLSRFAISVFPDEGTRMAFRLQPTDAVGVEQLDPVVYSTMWLKDTPGATYRMGNAGAMDPTAAPEGEPASNVAAHPEYGGYGTTTLPDDVMGGRDAFRMVWEFPVEEALTIHADTETPVAFPDPSTPGADDVELVRFNAMEFTIWKWTGVSQGRGTVRVEDVAPDGSAELLALRTQAAAEGEDAGEGPWKMSVPLPFIKRGKEFHTFQPGHAIRVVLEQSVLGNRGVPYTAYFFDGADYPAGLELRKGPYLEPPKAGDRLVLTYEGHTKAGASNPYGIAWVVDVPPEADPVINPLGIHRTGAGGYYVGTACPEGQSDCVGDTTVFFDVPQGAQTVYTQLHFTAPPVRDTTGLFNDYDILLYEPSGKSHTHTAGYGGNQPELQFHDVFETPEWPQKWWVEIFAFLVVDADWVCTVEIQF